MPVTPATQEAVVGLYHKFKADLGNLVSPCLQEYFLSGEGGNTWDVAQ
jgi:hypothetical protein